MNLQFTGFFTKMSDHKLNFSNRLNIALDKKELPTRGRAALLATTFGVTPKDSGKWLNGEAVPEIGKLIEISNWLEESIEWLLTGNSHSTASSDKNINILEKIPLEDELVPVVSWSQAKHFKKVDIALKNIKIKEWLPQNNDCGKNGFGLNVIGLSMAPVFVPDDRIYINPDYSIEDLKTGDLVIMACDGDDEATFKKLIVEGNSRYLQPLNPDWPEQIIKITDKYRLIGKVTGLYRKM